MSVPVEALDGLKCDACNKYLSYFPIYISQNKLPICGRCSEHLKEDTFIRAVPYESLCAYLKFPCIYEPEGCIEKLTPSEVPDHEKNCTFRMISCLMECVWQGTVKELHDHFVEQHQDSILRDDEFEIDFCNSYESFNLIIHEDEVFMLKRSFVEDANVLKYSVSCYKVLDPVTEYKYAITVKNANGARSIKFPPQSADNFHEQNVTEINVEQIRNNLDDPSVIIGTIKIFKVADTVSSQPKNPNPDVNHDMLLELECPVCLEYIIPPIFQCKTGHSVCGTCKSKIVECPLCKGGIENTQNFALERMTMFLTYPCKFYEHGCNFASNPAQIKQHQKFCMHGPHKCPLADYEDCHWEGAVKNIYAHIKEKHDDSVLDIDTVDVFIDPNDCFRTEEALGYIMKFGNSLFKLHYLYRQNTFFWAMQLIGPEEEANKFKFEIDINDNTDNNQRMFVRSACAPLTSKNESFSNIGRYVYFKHDQISSFITDELSYGVRIIK